MAAGDETPQLETNRSLYQQAAPRRPPLTPQQTDLTGQLARQNPALTQNSPGTIGNLSTLPPDQAARAATEAELATRTRALEAELRRMKDDPKALYVWYQSKSPTDQRLVMALNNGQAPEKPVGWFERNIASKLGGLNTTVRYVSGVEGVVQGLRAWGWVIERKRDYEAANLEGQLQAADEADEQSLGEFVRDRFLESTFDKNPVSNMLLGSVGRLVGLTPGVIDPNNADFGDFTQYMERVQRMLGDKGNVRDGAMADARDLIVGDGPDDDSADATLSLAHAIAVDLDPRILRRMATITAEDWEAFKSGQGDETTRRYITDYLAHVDGVVGQLLPGATEIDAQLRTSAMDQAIDQNFLKAVTVINFNQLSPGRVRAKQAGFEPGTESFRWVSGTMDAMEDILVDPVASAFGLGRVASVSRRLIVEGADEFSHAAVRGLRSGAPIADVGRAAIADGGDVVRKALRNDALQELEETVARSLDGVDTQVSDVVLGQTVTEVRRKAVRDLYAKHGDDMFQPQVRRGLQDVAEQLTLRGQAITGDLGADGAARLAKLHRLNPRLQDAVQSMGDEVFKPHRVDNPFEIIHPTEPRSIYRTIEPIDVFDWMESAAGSRLLQTSTALRSGGLFASQMPVLIHSPRIRANFLSHLKDWARLGIDEAADWGRRTTHAAREALQDPALSAAKRASLRAAQSAATVVSAPARLLQELTTTSTRSYIDVTDVKITSRVDALSRMLGTDGNRRYLTAISGASTVAERKTVMRNLLDELFDKMGVRFSDEGAEWANKFLETITLANHGQTEELAKVLRGRRYVPEGTADVINDTVTINGQKVDKYVATAMEMTQVENLMAMPDWKRLVRYAQFSNTFGRLLKSRAFSIDAWDVAAHRIWGPMVLATLGFPLRAGGEELLSFVMRANLGNGFRARMAARTLIPELAEKPILNAAQAPARWMLSRLNRLATWATPGKVAPYSMRTISDGFRRVGLRGTAAAVDRLVKQGRHVAEIGHRSVRRVQRAFVGERYVHAINSLADYLDFDSLYDEVLSGRSPEYMVGDVASHLGTDELAELRAKTQSSAADIEAGHLAAEGPDGALSDDKFLRSKLGSSEDPNLFWKRTAEWEAKEVSQDNLGWLAFNQRELQRGPVGRVLIQAWRQEMADIARTGSLRDLRGLVPALYGTDWQQSEFWSRVLERASRDLFDNEELYQQVIDQLVVFTRGLDGKSLPPEQAHNWDFVEMIPTVSAGWMATGSQIPLEVMGDVMRYGVSDDLLASATTVLDEVAQLTELQATHQRMLRYVHNEDDFTFLQMTLEQSQDPDLMNAGRGFGDFEEALDADYDVIAVFAPGRDEPVDMVSMDDALDMAMARGDIQTRIDQQIADLQDRAIDEAIEIEELPLGHPLRAVVERRFDEITWDFHDGLTLNGTDNITSRALYERVRDPQGMVDASAHLYGFSTKGQLRLIPESAVGYDRKVHNVLAKVQPDRWLASESAWARVWAETPGDTLMDLLHTVDAMADDLGPQTDLIFDDIALRLYTSNQKLGLSRRQQDIFAASPQKLETLRSSTLARERPDLVERATNIRRALNRLGFDDDGRIITRVQEQLANAGFDGWTRKTRMRAGERELPSSMRRIPFGKNGSEEFESRLLFNTSKLEATYQRNIGDLAQAYESTAPVRDFMVEGFRRYIDGMWRPIRGNVDNMIDAGIARADALASEGFEESIEEWTTLRAKIAAGELEPDDDKLVALRAFLAPQFAERMDTATRLLPGASHRLLTGQSFDEAYLREISNNPLEAMQEEARDLIELLRGEDDEALSELFLFDPGIDIRDVDQYRATLQGRIDLLDEELAAVDADLLDVLSDYGVDPSAGPDDLVSQLLEWRPSHRQTIEELDERFRPLMASKRRNFASKLRSMLNRKVEPGRVDIDELFSPDLAVRVEAAARTRDQILHRRSALEGQIRRADEAAAGRLAQMFLDALNPDRRATMKVQLTDAEQGLLHRSAVGPDEGNPEQFKVVTDPVNAANRLVRAERLAGALGLKPEVLLRASRRDGSVPLDKARQLLADDPLVTLNRRIIDAVGDGRAGTFDLTDSFGGLYADMTRGEELHRVNPKPVDTELAGRDLRKEIEQRRWYVVLSGNEKIANRQHGVELRRSKPFTAYANPDAARAAAPEGSEVVAVRLPKTHRSHATVEDGNYWRSQGGYNVTSPTAKVQPGRLSRDQRGYATNRYEMADGETIRSFGYDGDTSQFRMEVSGMWADEDFTVRRSRVVDEPGSNGLDHDRFVDSVRRQIQAGLTGDRELRHSVLEAIHGPQAAVDESRWLHKDLDDLTGNRDLVDLLQDMLDDPVFDRWLHGLDEDTVENLVARTSNLSGRRRLKMQQRDALKAKATASPGGRLVPVTDYLDDDGILGQLPVNSDGMIQLSRVPLAQYNDLVTAKGMVLPGTEEQIRNQAYEIVPRQAQLPAKMRRPVYEEERLNAAAAWFFKQSNNLMETLGGIVDWVSRNPMQTHNLATYFPVVFDDVWSRNALQPLREEITHRGFRTARQFKTDVYDTLVERAWRATEDAGTGRRIATDNRITAGYLAVEDALKLATTDAESAQVETAMRMMGMEPPQSMDELEDMLAFEFPVREREFAEALRQAGDEPKLLELAEKIEGNLDTAEFIRATGGTNPKFDQAMKDLLASDIPEAKLLRELADEAVRLGAITNPKDMVDAVERLVRGMDKADELVANRTLKAATEETLTWTDASPVRSFGQQRFRNLHPFWWAEERFAKRFARSTLANPAFYRWARLADKGLENAGIVEDGRFKIPLSALELPLMSRALGLFGVNPGELEDAGAITGKVSNLLSGLDTFGTLSGNPLVSISVSQFTSRMPELQPMMEEIFGPYAASVQPRPMLAQVLPSSINRAMEVFDPDIWVANAELDALQYMVYSGQDLDADPSNPVKWAQWQDKTADTARAAFLLRLGAGLMSPAGAYVEWAHAPLDRELSELVSQYGFIRGMEEFERRYPDRSWLIESQYENMARTQIRSTRTTFDQLRNNRDFYAEYPRAGAHFLAKPTVDEPYDRRAWAEMVRLGLQREQTTEEMYRAIKFNQAAGTYFDSRARLDEHLEALGDNTEAKREAQLSFRNWARDEFFPKHPVFAEELNKNLNQGWRDQFADEMERALVDARMPLGPQTEAVQTMWSSWKGYQAFLDSLYRDGTNAARRARAAEKDSFLAWGRSYIAKHPEVEDMWFRFIIPEIDMSTVEERELMSTSQLELEVTSEFLSQFENGSN